MRTTLQKELLIWPAILAGVITVASAAAAHLQVSIRRGDELVTIYPLPSVRGGMMQNSGQRNAAVREASRDADRDSGATFSHRHAVQRRDHTAVDRDVVSESTRSLIPFAKTLRVGVGRAGPRSFQPGPWFNPKAASESIAAMARRVWPQSLEMVLCRYVEAVGGRGTDRRSAMSWRLLSDPMGRLSGHNDVEQHDDVTLGPIKQFVRGPFDFTAIVRPAKVRIAARLGQSARPARTNGRSTNVRSTLRTPRLKSTIGGLVVPATVETNLGGPLQYQRDDNERGYESPGQPFLGQTSPQPSSTRFRLIRHASVWPATPALTEATNALNVALGESDLPLAPEVHDWLVDLENALALLRRGESLFDPTAAEPLKELRRLADAGIVLGESITGRPLQREMLRAAYAVDRRTAVWWDVHRIVNQFDDREFAEAGTAASVTSADVAAAIQDLQRDLDQTGDVEGWRKFLMLDQLDTALSDASVDRLVLSQTFLSRLHHHSMHPEAREFLSRKSVVELAERIRPWAGGAVDYAQLLRQIERIESDQTGLASVELADAIATLSHARSAAVLRLARTLTTHYQNANIRLAISESMLNRLIPAIAPQTRPIDRNLLGSRIRGVSTVTASAAVILQPSPDRWRLQLRSFGDVQTRSVGTRSGVAVRTLGRNQFTAVKPITIGADGIVASPAEVSATGQTRLRGIQTEYDGWPVIGSLVRSLAKSEFAQQRSRATRLASLSVRREVGQQIDIKVADQKQLATAKVSELLLGPLSTMNLDPQVMHLETTDHRLLARYRVAGGWQLGAFTPRVRALGDSLLSLQLHQSALNNTLEQLIPRARPMTVAELIEQSSQWFGVRLQPPADVPEGVTIEFTETRPMTIEFADGLVYVTMRIDSLRRDGETALNSFAVRATYRVVVDGVNVRLMRQGHLNISGPGMSFRQRLPIRLVFNKVLQDDRPIAITPASIAASAAMDGLAVTQCELRDGWVGIGLSEVATQRVALR